MSVTTSVLSELHHEVRGAGAPVVFISGASGDAGHFGRAAERLADEFTAVTFDRRGCSRSRSAAAPGPMKIDEQADDVAALIGELGIAPAVVFGTSGGGNIALGLIARHPGVLRAAIIHEPALIAVAPDSTDRGDLDAILDLASHSPRAAMEAFLREHTSDATFEGLDPALRERVLTNGANFFGRELEAFASFVPAVDRIREAGVPLRVLVGRESAPAYGKAAEWLGQALDLPVGSLSGHHAPYLQHPERFAEELRAILRTM